MVRQGARGGGDTKFAGDLARVAEMDSTNAGEFREAGADGDCVLRGGRQDVGIMGVENSIVIRVRYPEVDAMGFLHHSRYLQYFEMGRVELLRSLGHSYAELERQGVLFVVARVECRYKSPARYDEELTLVTRVVKQTHVRIDHAYELKRGSALLAEASTTIACVDREGNLRQIPDFLQRGAAE